MSAPATRERDSHADLELAERVALRDPAAVRLMTERNNQRLYRAAWSILRNREDSEDAVQAAYLRGFDAIRAFEGRSSLSTWLMRIAINESLGRLRARNRRTAFVEGSSVLFGESGPGTAMCTGASPTAPAAPDASLGRWEIRNKVEQAVARLPYPFRSVFVLRAVEGLSVAEVAGALDIPAATVKSRYHRARRRLQEDLGADVKRALVGVFPFAGADCAALTRNVLRKYCAAESCDA